MSMTKRDLARLERRVARERAERDRLSECAEAGPSFESRSDRSGRERNAWLRKLNELNQHSPHPTERRKAGFPSTFGPLARRAAEQTETANEARARRLSPSIVRLAQEAADFRPEPIRHPRWLRWFIVICAVVLFYALAYHWPWPWGLEGRP